MASNYGYEIWFRKKLVVKPFFSEFACFLIFQQQVNNVDTIMQSAYLCVILYVKHKMLPLPCSLNLISNSW